MNGHNDDNTRRLILSDKPDEVEEGLATLFTDHVGGVKTKLDREFEADLVEQDWEEVLSDTVHDVYCMRKNNGIAETGDLAAILYTAAWYRASNKRRYNRRRRFIKTGQRWMSDPEAVAETDGIYLQEAIESYVLKLPVTDQLVLETAAELNILRSAKRLRDVPMDELINIVNKQVKTRITENKARKILAHHWGYLRAFLKREGFSNEG